ncbi:MAG TPA: hypothetical protein VMV03_14580 [Spirochaetia bacterium]|nr:hypothetical protein [Spirochaetia bacterium]
MRSSMDARIGPFVRELFFDIQTIEGVKPLEIWNGIREADDPFEITSLVKNLYKITLPLVNELCAGLPFDVHAVRAQKTVEGVLRFFLEDPEERLYKRFPHPPTGEPGQKDLYRLIKDKAREVSAALAGRAAPSSWQPPNLDAGVFPDGLFDFREMRIVDNELPFIIFTDKEYGVIHGLAIVYSWLIGLDTIFLQTLADNRVDQAIIDEYRAFSTRVHAENPLMIQGTRTTAADLTRVIQEKLRQQDYLDLFEGVYRRFEESRKKFTA